MTVKKGKRNQQYKITVKYACHFVWQSDTYYSSYRAIKIWLLGSVLDLGIFFFHFFMCRSVGKKNITWNTGSVGTNKILH